MFYVLHGWEQERVYNISTTPSVAKTISAKKTGHDNQQFSTQIKSYILGKLKKMKSWKPFLICLLTSRANQASGAPVAFKTWCGHQCRVGIICPPLVDIGLG